MSRAIFTSSCGDPFLLSLCIKLFQERFYNEVDAYYVNINNHSQVPQEVISKLLAKISLDPKMHIIYHPRGRGNGPPITEMLQVCLEDYIALIEDDFFIFEPGVVDEYFKKIESDYDVVGSPRYTYGEVADAARAKYSLDYSGEGDKGFGWWPAGFYCKREDLLKTDLDFASKAYIAGETYKELDHTFTETCYTDTFTWASLQLRYLGIRSFEVPQNHASPNEIEEYEKKGLKWAGEQPKYIHGGSLSAGWSGYLSGQIPDLSNQNAILEIETRVAFWTIASDVIEGFTDFKKAYKEGIENLIVNGNLDRGRIVKKIQIYKELMNV